jgi:hypothetical protein
LICNHNSHQLKARLRQRRQIRHHTADPQLQLLALALVSGAAEAIEQSISSSYVLFDVRCSMFDVRCSMFDVRCLALILIQIQVKIHFASTQEWRARERSGLGVRRLRVRGAKG